jgi:hypothetical protein
VEGVHLEFEIFDAVAVTASRWSSLIPVVFAFGKVAEALAIRILFIGEVVKVAIGFELTEAGTGEPTTKGRSRRGSGLHGGGFSGKCDGRYGAGSCNKCS